MVLIDLGHIFLTFPVYAKRAKVLFPLPAARVGIPILVLIATIAFSVYAHPWFLYFVAYATLLHIARQHGGILKAVLKSDRCESIHIHMAMYWAIFLFAFLHLHSAASSFNRFYYTEGDMFRPLPGELLKAGTTYMPTVFAIYILLCTYFALRNQSVSARAIVLQCGAFLWFYGGWILFADTSYYFMISTVLHGGSYIIFSVEARDRFLAPSLRRKPSAHLGYLIPVAIIALIWAGLRPELQWLALDRETSLMGRVAWGVFWAPGMLHFFLDSLMWRTTVVQDALISAS